MNFKFLALSLLIVLTFSCGKKDDTSSSVAELVSFTAAAGTDTTTQIDLQITFPSSTTGYESVKIFRSSGLTAPSCGAGTLVNNITSFATNPLTSTDSNLSITTDYSYRACVYSNGNVTSNKVATLTTAGTCLVGETVVSTPAGSVFLSNLKKGDFVYSYKKLEKKVVSAKIIMTKAYGIKKVGTLNINDKSITGVPAHRVFNYVSSNYVPLSSFDNNENNYLSKDYGFVFIDQNEKKSFLLQNPSVTFYEQTSEPVFDILVEGDNNFFANGILVQGM